MKIWRALLPFAGVVAFAALQTGIAAQTPDHNQNPAPPAAPAAAPATPAAPTAKPAAPSEPQSAKPKARHVFTDDDVPALRAQGGIANDDGPGSKMIYGAVGPCDANCEELIKQRLDVSEEEEGQWKLQLTAARRQLGEDRQWRELYWKGQQTMNFVCNLRRQEELVLLPTGNDFQSRLERAKQLKSFQEQEDSSRRQLQNNVAGIEHYAQQYYAREPVRAMMMAVIAEKLLNDCPEVPAP